MTTRKDIENALMRGADTLRDTIDAANYKDYVLPIMFVKYLSDSYEDALDKLRNEYSGVRLERQKKYLPFTVAENCSYQSLYEHRFADNIGQLINAAMRQIEDDNNQQLTGVLSTIDYNSENALGTREHKNAILRDLLEDFASLDLRPTMIEVKEGQVPADVIGDAYEYMIGQFASMAGKKAGSFYTPAAVSEVMAQIVNVQPGERVYDPTCGSGSLLIKAAKKQNIKEVSIFGQEVNGSSVAMAKMNMYIHEIRDAKIGWGIHWHILFFLIPMGICCSLMQLLRICRSPKISGPQVSILAVNQAVKVKKILKWKHIWISFIALIGEFLLPVKGIGRFCCT